MLSLVLRDVTEDDLPILFEHQLDPEASRMAAFRPRDREAFWAHWTRIMGDETVTKKTVVVDGRVAGNFVGFNWSDRREVGYWIGREFWGKGIATRALSEFLQHHEKTRPLYAGVAKRNVASIRVLEKCGFANLGDYSGGADIEEVLLKLEA